MAKSKARFLSELLGSTGLVKKSKSALAGADEVLDLDTIPTIPNSKLQNSSISIAGHSTALGDSVSLNTGNISEHTDYKYYTDARARGAVSVSGDLAYNSSTGVISFTERTDAEVRGLFSAGGSLSYNSSTGVMSFTMPAQNTSNITEGTNLYFTNARARSAISATGSLSYNSTTGVMSFTMPAQNTSNITEGTNLYYTDARADARIAAASTSDLSEGTNLYYTDARADARVALIVDSAPGTLNTLNELAAALGDDANFSTTVTNSIATKLPLAGGALTGAVTTNSTFDGRNVSVDGAKLDGIEAGATADQTAAEILTAIKTVDGSGSGLDADTVDGVQASRIIYGSNSSGTGEGSFSNWNSIDKSGFYSHSGATNKWSTSNWSSVLHHRLYSSNNSYATQLGFDTYNNNLYTRTNNNGTWTSWSEIWHAGVDGSGSGLDADLLDGQQGSYYYPASNPNGYTNDQTAAEILTAIKTVDGSGSGLDADLLDGMNSSSSVVANTIVARQANGYIYANHINFSTSETENPTINSFLVSNGDGWSRKASKAHVASQMGAHLVRTDGSNPAFVKVPANYTGNLNSISNAGVYFTEGTGSISNNPFSSSGSFLQFGDAGGTDVRLQFYAKSSLDRIAFRNQWGNNNWGGWHEFWTTQNDGSGSGLDADLLDGVNSDTAANANTIVKRDANGYINGVYFNSAIGVSESIALNPTKIYMSNDNYIRTMSKSDFKVRMNLTKNTYDRMNYTSNTHYHTGANSHNEVSINGLWERGSGFIDNWNSGAGKPPSGSHFNGFQALHYSSSSVYHHGMQMLMSAGNPALTFLRGWWANGGSGYAWQKIWTDGNDGSGSGLDADLLDGVHGTSFIRSDADDSFTGNLTTGANNHITFGPNSTWGSYLRIGGNGRTATGTEMASIATTDGNIHLDAANSSNGIYLNYYAGTNGTYFGNGASGVVAKMFADGQLYKSSTTTNPYWNSTNDGSGSGLDADLLDGQHGSYYQAALGTSARWPIAYISGHAVQSYDKLRVWSDSNYTIGMHSGQTYGWLNDYAMTFQMNNDSDRGFVWRHSAMAASDGAMSLTTGGNLSVKNAISLGGSTTYYMQVGSWGWRHQTPSGYIEFGPANTSHAHIYTDRPNFYFNKELLVNNNTVWHAGNDGSGSGLDADLLDGQQGSYYYAASNPSGYQTGTGTVTQSHYVSGNAFATTGSPGSVLEYQQASGQTDTRLAPSGDWHNSIRMGHGNPYNYYSNTLAARMTGAYGDWYTQTIYNNSPQGWRKIWNTGNDGAGSGLDADLLDGQHGSYYFSSANYPERTNFENVYNNLSTSTGAGANLNTAFQNSRSGFIDCWSGSNLPSGTSHVQGIQARHTTGSHYGFQLVNQYNQDKIWHRRITNSSFAGWQQVWTANSDGSGSGLDADLLDGLHAASFVRSDAGSTIANNVVTTQRGSFTTGTSGQNNAGIGGSYNYGYQYAGGWSAPFPDLVMGYHTGMRFGGYTAYGGCRFYSDHPSRTTTILFSVGNGDTHVRATNNIYAYTSDRRLKENFRPIENAVDKVKAIGGFIFDWRKDMMEKHDFTPDQQKDDAGLIAQEVQKVMPAAIKRAPFDHDLTKPNQSKSGEEFLTVQYEKMVPLLVEAIKEQQKQIDELKKLLEEKE